jgi:hypothetical protein
VHGACELLSLVQAPGDRALAVQLQSAMDALVAAIQGSSLAVVAPAYPYEWLRKKALLSIAHFQEEMVLGSSLKPWLGMDGTVKREEPPAPVKSWWLIAAEGIEFWSKKKKLVWQLPPEATDSNLGLG